MKYILVLIIFAFNLLPLFGAYQYISKNNIFGKSGNAYFTFDSDTSLYINDVNFISKSTFPFKELFNPTDFGYYKIGSHDFISAENGKLGDFTSSDKIGIWIKDGFGNMFVTYKDYSYFGYSSKHDDTYWLSIGDHNRYEYTLSENLKGQPLPGIFMSLIAGSISCFVLKMKKV